MSNKKVICFTRYAEMLNKDIMPEGYLEAPLAYDAVWATALGKLGLKFILFLILWRDFISVKIPQ